MKKEYEEIVQNVCKLSNWKSANADERNGAIGVACTLAYIRGTPANPTDLANDVGLSPNDVVIPYRRLLVDGIFSDSYNIRNDDIFLGYGEDKSISGGFSFTFTGAEQTRNAWSIIAGIASGFCGLRETEPFAEAA